MSTTIEWTRNQDGTQGRTWNLVTGCDRISDGCQNCYALTMAKRLKAMGSARYQADGDPRTSGPGFAVTLHPDLIDAPRRWRSTTVFVNSMSDLFHAKVPLEFIQQAFQVMAETPQHRYQILTKRARRLRMLADRLPWPSNAWMGVSVEDEKNLHRVDELRQVPAAVRFLSCEPLLGPLPSLNLEGISWVIAGAESGRGARPMNEQWVRDIKNRCVERGVPFFYKQDAINGKKLPLPELDGQVWAQMPSAVSA